MSRLELPFEPLEPLEPIDPIPFIPVPLTEGTLVREVSRPEVYILYDDKKIWIPTPDTLFIMGYTWDDVRVVPDGALAHLPEARIDAASPTPGSLVFPPNYTRHFAITGVNTSLRVISQGKEVRIIELRGWLYPESPATNAESEWDDYHYLFEVDSAWAIEQGIDLNRLLKVGNILISEGYAISKGSPDAYRSVSLPRIGLEINGWKPSNSRGVARPNDWIPPMLDECPGTHWPYDPRIQLTGSRDDEELAPYVRIVGSLIVDNAHNHGAADVWEGGEGEENPARHTEMHPPDRIQLLSPQGRRETLRGIAVGAANGPFDAAEQELSVRIFPPGPRPSPEYRVAVIELVGAETNYGTIIEGNALRTGARLTITDEDVDVYVKVARTGLWGVPGKFKALYRVFWEVAPPAPLQRWSDQANGWFQTDDHDYIEFTIERDVAAPDIVEFVLTLGPGVTWKKILNMPDGLGSNWDIEAVGEGGSGSNALWADQVQNGQFLTFKKAKAFGFIWELFKLGDLGGLTPGSRVTFRWVKDS